MLPLDKHQLWITDDGCVYCIDHILFTERFAGRRATPADYAEHIELVGETLSCDLCEEAENDEERPANVYLLFGKNSASRLQRARAAHPSSGQTSQRGSEKGEKK